MPAAGHPFTRLFRYARDLQPLIRRGALLSVLNKIFDLAPPILIGAAVDVVVSRQESFIAQLGITSLSLQLWVLAGITLLVWIAESVFEYFASVSWRTLAQELQHRLRLDTYRQVQKLDMAFFEQRSTGQLMSILNDDVNQLERFLDIGAHEILLLATTIVVVGGLFIGIVPDLAWMTILPMPFIALASLLFQKRIEPRYAAVREQAGEINARLANNLQGISTIKSFTAEHFEADAVDVESQRYRERNASAIRLSSSFVPLIRMLIVLGFAAIMVYGGQKALAGELNVGAYSVLVFMTQRLLWPLTRLGTTLDLYYRASASTGRILGLLEREPELLEGAQTLNPREISGAVRFDKVGFSYPAREEVLRDVSFRVEPGKTLGVVGATGSGKTTLIKLLLRFYDPSHGTIFIDERPIQELSLHSLRQAVSLVSQDVFLVDGSVRDNIAYGSAERSAQEIERAAQFAEIHEFVQTLPEGYDTRIGERGQRLSGGQRQRIAIARAILKDAPVLVLDEATSSVDNETEAAIQRALRRLMGKKTMIVIAHRLSTVRAADAIIVFESGRLVEQGRHEELLARNGLYAALWQIQTGEVESGEAVQQRA